MRRPAGFCATPAASRDCSGRVRLIAWFALPLRFASGHESRSATTSVNQFIVIAIDEASTLARRSMLIGGTHMKITKVAQSRFVERWLNVERELIEKNAAGQETSIKMGCGSGPDARPLGWS
jgi:hypothetical protein